MLIRHSNQKPPSRYVEGKIVYTSAEQARPPQFGTDETMNFYATVRCFCRQACNGVVVKLAAGDDMDVVPGVPPSGTRAGIKSGLSQNDREKNID